jgi:hypothetical protein
MGICARIISVTTLAAANIKPERWMTIRAGYLYRSRSQLPVQMLIE